MNVLLSPPLALLAYITLVAVLVGFGRLLAPAGRRAAAETLYAGGEVAATSKAAPGYRRFFVVALFFAVLHLGALVLATAGLAGGVVLGPAFSTALLIYLGGLVVALLILLLS